MTNQDNLYSQASNLPEQQITWLWENFIALGNISLLQGEPGAGKTNFALRLIANLTQGKSPDGTSSQSQINCMYLTTENGIQDTIIPRLIRVGANMDNVYLQNSMGVVGDIVTISKCVLENNIKLLVLDPLQSFIGGKTDIYRTNEVRAALAPYAELASRYNCAILFIGHLTKNTLSSALNRTIGSVDFIAAMRSIIFVSRDNFDEDTIIIKLGKSNLCNPNKIDALIYKQSTINGHPILTYNGTSNIALETITNDNRTSKAAPIRQKIIKLIEAEINSGKTGEKYKHVNVLAQLPQSQTASYWKVIEEYGAKYQITRRSQLSQLEL